MWYIFHEKTIIWKFLCVAQGNSFEGSTTWTRHKKNLRFWKKNPCFKMLYYCFIWELYGRRKSTTLEPYRLWTTWLAESGQWKKQLGWKTLMFEERTDVKWENGLFRQGTNGHCGHWLPLSFSLCLIIVASTDEVMFFTRVCSFVSKIMQIGLNWIAPNVVERRGPKGRKTKQKKIKHHFLGQIRIMCYEFECFCSESLVYVVWHWPRRRCVLHWVPF